MNILYILLALFIFGFLIFIHELGHFIVARLCGVKVLEFAIGMGPKIISWKSKKSGTAYSIRLLPIGGFVSMLGENGMEVVQGEQPKEQQDSEDKESKQSFFLSPDENDEGSAKNEGEFVELTAEEAKHAYCNQSVWKRMLISLAGPAMNVVLGFILMMVIVIAIGKGGVGTTQIRSFYVVYAADEATDGLLKGDYIQSVNGIRIESMSEMKDVVSDLSGQQTVVEILRWDEEEQITKRMTLSDVNLTAELLDTHFVSSASEKHGLQVGDEIKKIGNTNVYTYYDLSYEIMMQGYRAVDVTVLRDGKNTVLEDVMFPNTTEEGILIGSMDFMIYGESDFNVGTVLKHTWHRSVSMVKMVFDSLSGLFSGRYGFEAVSGPVGITQTITEVAKTGLMDVLALVTLISINLGIMNLLPLPALDGGHLLIYIVEAIRRKPLKKEIEGVINFVGLILLLSLAVIIMIKDIIAL